MALFKNRPEDFVVDEIPAYEPSGQGEHLYLHLQKTNRTTDDVVRELARALDVAARDIGVAGLKDKVGVTTQWVSVPRPPKIAREAFEAQAHAMTLGGVRLLAAKWHGNKLKTGHLRGNRFDLLVTDVADVEAAVARFEAIRREGVPNDFGPQRFGRDGQNVERARAFLSGKAAPPRDPKQRRFLFSAWQSWLFNAVLERRRLAGTWTRVLAGDWVAKHDSGGIFLSTDAEADSARAQALSVSATGPMFGASMRWPEGEVRDLERAILSEELARLAVPDEDAFFRRHAALGEGTRRPLRQIVTELQVLREQPAALRVQFVLPSGAYATTVLAYAIPGLAEAAPEGRPDSVAVESPNE